MKTCIRCGQPRPLEMYCKGRDKDGLHPWCRDCRTEYTREYRKTKPPKNYTTSDENRRGHLLRAYGLTVEQYDEMLVTQGGKCAVCPTEAGTTTRSFAVDHDHSCCPGKKTCGRCIRGLLCTNCNMALGLVKEDRETLESMIAYLDFCNRMRQ